MMLQHYTARNFASLSPLLSPASHLEERLLDQAQVRAPYSPLFGGSFALHTPYYDIRCSTTCKIIILGDKMNPNDCFDSDPSNPLPTPRTWVPFSAGIGAGSKLGLALATTVCQQ